MLLQSIAVVLLVLISPPKITWIGILLYEMLYGYTPFRGKTRQKTFANILHKDLRFPGSISVSSSIEVFISDYKIGKFVFFVWHYIFSYFLRKIWTFGSQNKWSCRHSRILVVFCSLQTVAQLIYSHTGKFYGHQWKL